MAGERILLVDDEVSIQRLLLRILQRDGYDVVVAGDGSEAYAALERGPIDIGIVDLVLPDANGLDILRRSKELYPDAEVIILTGYGDMQTAVESLRLGAYDYLAKPLDDLQLIPLTIGRALERQRLARSNRALVAQLKDANRELEVRRRQQIAHIQQIGQALTGALHVDDVARTLSQAILGSVDCSVAAVLLLPRGHMRVASLTVASRGTLSPVVRDRLGGMLCEQLPESRRIDPLTLDVLCIEGAGDAIDESELARSQYRDLVVRDEVYGVAFLVQAQPADEKVDESGVLDILTSQGSIALQNALLFERMRELATRDSLTGLYNHGHFFELLESEISRSVRHSQELAVIMMDVDRSQGGLKAINDTYGHQAGDALLAQLASLLMDNVRRADAVARYGGDEFIILAPQIGPHDAMTLAERICCTVREMGFDVSGHEEHVTVSVGVAIFHPGSGQSANDVVSQADASLYLAKGRGGDQVAIIESIEAP